MLISKIIDLNRILLHQSIFCLRKQIISAGENAPDCKLIVSIIYFTGD